MDNYGIVPYLRVIQYYNLLIHGIVTGRATWPSAPEATVPLTSTPFLCAKSRFSGHL